eukprot:812754-Rhodomonas_salina.1
MRFPATPFLTPSSPSLPAPLQGALLNPSSILLPPPPIHPPSSILHLHHPSSRPRILFCRLSESWGADRACSSFASPAASSSPMCVLPPGQEHTQPVSFDIVLSVILTSVCWRFAGARVAL